MEGKKATIRQTLFCFPLCLLNHRQLALVFFDYATARKGRQHEETPIGELAIALLGILFRSSRIRIVKRG